MTTVTVTRAKLTRPGRSYGRVGWVWTYDYRVDGGPVCQCGPGLADLRAMLRRRYGRDVTIEETWK
jgi:hypothetical protein